MTHTTETITPNDHGDDARLRAALADLVDGLPTLYATAVRLRFWHSLSWREVAKEMGLSEQFVAVMWEDEIRPRLLGSFTVGVAA